MQSCALALPLQYVGPGRCGRVGKAYRAREDWASTAVCGAAGYSARGGVVFFPLSRKLGSRGIRRAISAGFVARDRPGGMANKRGIF